MRFRINFRWIFSCITSCFPGFLMAASVHHPEAFVSGLGNQANAGQQIVAQFCSVCHAPNPVIPLGAPRAGVAADWKHRTEAGMDVLFQHTVEGYNAMPPRGGCFECSDAQLMLAIEALIPVLR